MQPSHTRRRLWVADIRRIVAKETGVSVEALTGPRRGNRYVNARFVFAVLTLEFLPHITRKQIANQFLKRDHSCVYNMLDRAEVFLARTEVSDALALCRDKIELFCAQEPQRAPLTPILGLTPISPPPKPKPRTAASYEAPRACLYSPMTSAGAWREEEPLDLQCRQNEERMRRAMRAAHPELGAFLPEEI